MLTAKDGDLDEAEALDTGADDYLTKPFSFAVLVARIRALLRRADRAQPGAGRGRRPPHRSRPAPGVARRCRDRADRTPVRRARVPDPPGGPGPVQDRDPRRRLGLRIRGRPQHRRGLHPAAAEPDRRAIRQARDRDHSRRRLPTRRPTGAERRAIALASASASPLGRRSPWWRCCWLPAERRSSCCNADALIDELDQTLTQRADDIVALLENGACPRGAGRRTRGGVRATGGPLTARSWRPPPT